MSRKVGMRLAKTADMGGRNLEAHRAVFKGGFQMCMKPDVQFSDVQEALSLY